MRAHHATANAIVNRRSLAQGMFFLACYKSSFGTELHLLGSRLIPLINGEFGGIGEGMAGRSFS
ncbi:hypothetical protein [Aeromonas hydrophila]|uniref:hypothetical protein n=1 Tax=Aeromonas hydrophila TaxID=644 RepID=UPI0014553BBA|nr:hypothetical protein [Aeromonas hydrophila]NLR35539.1 hypothetical protein [Aeromonas hydrophila]